MQTKATADVSDLIYHIKCHDQSAFTTLYNAYSGALYAFLIKTLTSDITAQDALQNTFVKVWLGIQSFNPEKGSLFTWMLNIARNEAIDLLRSKYHRQALLTDSVSCIEIRDREHPFRQLDLIGVQNLLVVLKPMHRVIFELHFFRGFTCEEIAGILQMPCGTVKTKLQGGYRTLRTALSERVTTPVV